MPEEQKKDPTELEKADGNLEKEENIEEKKEADDLQEEAHNSEDDPLADLMPEEDPEQGEPEGPADSLASPPEGEAEQEDDLDHNIEETSPENEPSDDLLASLLEEEAEDSQEEEELASQRDDSSTEGAEAHAEKSSPPGEEAEAEKGKIAFLAPLVGIFLVFIALIGGVIVLWRLWHLPVILPKKAQVPKKKEVSTPKVQPPLVVAPIVPERKLLILDNFLIPYQRENGDYAFVKSKILLYFSDDKSFLRVQKDITLWREQVYQVLKNIPLYVWQDPKGKDVVRKQLLSYLKKVRPDGIVPVDLEVAGYILD